MASSTALGEAIGRASASVDSLRRFAGADVSGLPRAELVAVLRGAAAARRQADAILSVASAELSRRSEDQGGMAKREGFKDARSMIASATGGTMAEADRLIQAGDLIAPPPPPPAPPSWATREPSPAPLPEPAEAHHGDSPADEPPSRSPLAQVRERLGAMSMAGDLSVDAVAVLRTTLEGLPDTEPVAQVFMAAAEKAVGLSAFQVRKLAWSAHAAADPEGWAERQREQRTRRYLLLRDERDGMVKLDGRLDALTAAAIKQVVEAGITHAFNVRRDARRRGAAGSPARPGNLSYPGAVEGEDVRERAQIAADVLADVFRHAAGCDELATGTTMSIVVRMDESDLRQGLGNGTIDNSDLPLPVRDLRAAAADAEIIPMVLNASSTALDLGRSRRLFTRAQKIALIERDGGCAWCNAPPVRCHAHHIKWWERDNGETNLDNGIMLCSRCHHRIHDTGWEIRVRNGAVEFIPPATIDPDRIPVPGGRRRFEVHRADVREPEPEVVGTTLPATRPIPTTSTPAPAGSRLTTVTGRSGWQAA